MESETITREKVISIRNDGRVINVIRQTSTRQFMREYLQIHDHRTGIRITFDGPDFLEHALKLSEAIEKLASEECGLPKSN